MNGCAPKPAEEAAPALRYLRSRHPAARGRKPNIHTTWMFRTGGDDCAAEASAAGVSLQMGKQRDAPMSLSLAIQPVSLRSQAPFPFVLMGRPVRGVSLGALLDRMPWLRHSALTQPR